LWARTAAAALSNLLSGLHHFGMVGMPYAAAPREAESTDIESR
jgi:hypothetical protein